MNSSSKGGPEMGKIKSRWNLHGGQDFYDEKGRKIGYSRENLLDGYNYYDKKGKKVGYSTPNFFSEGYTIYDNKGRKQGTLKRDLFDGYEIYDAKGRRTGKGSRTLGNGFNITTKDKPAKKEGCYIATCVYGSYDAPNVRVLRRFRDERLAASIPGRAFIRLYYAVSPVMVRLFGNNALFRMFFRRVLDRIVERLS